MTNRKWLALITMALTAGLVLGNLATASAATGSASNSNPIVAGACGLGSQVGASMRAAGGRLADVVASLTGKSVTDVQAERASGKSFSQIAEESDVSEDDVVARTLAVRKAVLDESVKSGNVTQDQADQALETMKSRLTFRMSNTGAGCGGGGGRGNGCGGGGCGGAPATK